ncbi:SWIM zinc finger family protein [Xanthomonas medicagonis]|uniref:SWIM zinc finger family protein n=1 Tax=Xanthomonas medicagonis TaxID=3160841 RepID=UPI003514DEE4
MTTFSPTQIDSALLLEITSDSYYQRGLAYAEEDRVTLLAMDARSADADVAGSQNYGVRLEWRDGSLHGTCDCPIGMENAFCKHQVATALVWAQAAASAGDGQRSDRDTKRVPTSNSVLRQWLAGQPAEILQALLMEAAEDDPALRQRLLSQAQLASAPPQDWRKAVSALLGRKRFMDHSDSIAYAKRLRPLDALLDQARQRDPAAALDLYEYAFARLLAIYADCDDSGGHIGERLRRLARLHPTFARSAAPSNLAKRVFDLRMQDEWDLLPPLRDYGELLSASAIATLEHLALHALHGTRDHGQRLAAETLLEEAGRGGGNVESMLEWFASHCDSAWDHLEMARRCAEHGRERQAIEWLERGRKAHPRETRLQAALAEAYARDGFPEDALQLRWNVYALEPLEDTYLALREAALALGSWESWRERALDSLDGGASRKPAHARDLRIRLLLAEEQAQRALDMAQGHLHTLAVETLERLLAPAEALDPAAAATICDRLIDVAIARTNRRGYLEAVDLLPVRQRLYATLGDPGGFAAYIDQLRKRYQRKRNFIELLDARLATAAKPRRR